VLDQNRNEERSFESAFAELEKVVRQLEEGELSLEEAISLYERGQALSRFCQDRLDQAELRVTQLASRSGGGILPAEDDTC
jgi:exodeoxyribonuclease VII small subunit